MSSLADLYTPPFLRKDIDEVNKDLDQPTVPLSEYELVYDALMAHLAKEKKRHEYGTKASEFKMSPEERKKYHVKALKQTKSFIKSIEFAKRRATNA